MDWENPVPLLAIERLNVPAESSWLAETVAFKPAKTLFPATRITDPTKTEVAASRN